jgi:hypothetical protein
MKKCGWALALLLMTLILAAAYPLSAQCAGGQMDPNMTGHTGSTWVKEGNPPTTLQPLSDSELSVLRGTDSGMDCVNQAAMAPTALVPTKTGGVMVCATPDLPCAPKVMVTTTTGTVVAPSK